MVYVAVCDFSLMPCLAVFVEFSYLMGGGTFIFMRAIFSTRHAQHVITGTFPLPIGLVLQSLCNQAGHSENTVLLPLHHLFAHAASTTGTIFSFTRLSAAKSASHDYMNVFHASHCRTYYNTKLLQLSASSLLLTVFGPDAAITTTIAPATHRWCWLLCSRHRRLA